MTFGFALVDFSEEFVFRGAFRGALAELGWRPWAVVLAPALLFGLIHWSRGLGLAASGAVVGVVLMLALMHTGSMRPGISAYYGMLLIVFGLAA